MKTVYLWIADYGTAVHPNNQYDCSLFFSSREAFEKLYTGSDVAEQQLVAVRVVDTFDNLDYIPDNY
jgi:hypothetical protein